jgi:aquaporin Z
MIKYLTEFIGTLFLVLTIGLSVISQSPMAPLSIGLALMIMVYMGGHISGAHYNPAVTLAFLLRGKLPAGEVIPYIVSQLLGATVASVIAFVITGQTFAPMPGATASPVSVLLVEILFTFALVLVVFNVATHPKTTGNAFYGLAIGMTLATGVFAGGAVSGGAFNPAVGFGPTLVNAILSGGAFSSLWYYFVGPLAGAGLAAVVYKLQEEG